MKAKALFLAIVSIFFFKFASAQWQRNSCPDRIIVLTGNNYDIRKIGEEKKDYANVDIETGANTKILSYSVTYKWGNTETKDNLNDSYEVIGGYVPLTISVTYVCYGNEYHVFAIKVLKEGSYGISIGQ